MEFVGVQGFCEEHVMVKYCEVRSVRREGVRDYVFLIIVQV